jgi:hypothetical protein
MSKKRKPPPGHSPARAATGAHSAVKLALNLAGGIGTPAPEEEQFTLADLLGLPETQALTDLRAAEAAKTGGRPKGALNKRTVEWAEFLLTRYASPLEVLCQIANASVVELVASLGCSKLEALQEKRLAALGLAPYLHSKMPVSIDVHNKNYVYLTINNNQFALGQGAGLTATVIEGTKAEGA